MVNDANQGPTRVLYRLRRYEQLRRNDNVAFSAASSCAMGAAGAISRLGRGEKI